MDIQDYLESLQAVDEAKQRLTDLSESPKDALNKIGQELFAASIMQPNNSPIKIYNWGKKIAVDAKLPTSFEEAESKAQDLLQRGKTALQEGITALQEGIKDARLKISEGVDNTMKRVRNMFGDTLDDLEEGTIGLGKKAATQLGNIADDEVAYSRFTGIPSELIDDEFGQIQQVPKTIFSRIGKINVTSSGKQLIKAPKISDAPTKFVPEGEQKREAGEEDIKEGDIGTGITEAGETTGVEGALEEATADTTVFDETPVGALVTGLLGIATIGSELAKVFEHHAKPIPFQAATQIGT
jgi:hypothetical protein